MGSMAPPRPPKRVLLLTNSEHGQANVFLATSYALLTLPDEDVEVHFASFAPIRKHVAAVSAYAAEKSPPGKPARPIVFHELAGLDMMTAWSRPEFEAEKDGSRHAQGLIHAWRRMSVLLSVTLPWSGPEFVEVFESIADVVRRVHPHVTAVDPAFSPALTAARHLGLRYLVLAPNAIKDFAMPAQPAAEALWRYPCVGSAFPFPVPLRLVPLNILLVLLGLLAAALDPRRRDLAAYVRAHTDGGVELVTLNDVSLGPPSPGVKFLVANRMALELPLRVLPLHVVPCGPIVRPARPVAEADPELAAWLARGPTAYVNLGTHVLMSEESAVQMATALRILLDHARSSAARRDKRLAGLRVLWKLAMEEREDGEQSGIYAILGRDVTAGDVRIVRWIEAEPTAVLESGNVVCAVHHGGANSFLEAASAGIPQVVLPVWMDTFDFARRAEWLGIGRWGNKISKQKGWGGELGNALIDVVLGEESAAIRERAQAVRRLCAEDGGGRVIAARMILREIREEVVAAEEEENETIENGKEEKEELVSLISSRAEG